MVAESTHMEKGACSSESGAALSRRVVPLSLGSVFEARLFSGSLKVALESPQGFSRNLLALHCFLKKDNGRNGFAVHTCFSEKGEDVSLEHLNLAERS